MTIELLKDHIAMPWANGGGITYEVARYPNNGDFDWRISLADIDSDGPFSVLSGIDRTLVLLEGRQVVLTNQAEVKQLDELHVFNFPGEIAYECKLSAGFAKDLNIMIRRGKFTSNTVVIGAGTHQIDATKDVHIIVDLRGVITVDGEKLNYRDAARLAGNHTVVSDGAFAHITITAV